MYAVTTEDATPPRLPKVFIKAESEAEKSGARSMQAAQKLAAANILNPAASAIIGRATAVTLRWLPNSKRIVETPMPSHTATRRPRRRVEPRAIRSENQPPTGASTAMERNGAEVQTAAASRPSPRTCTA